METGRPAERAGRGTGFSLRVILRTGAMLCVCVRVCARVRVWEPYWAQRDASPAFRTACWARVDWPAAGGLFRQ